VTLVAEQQDGSGIKWESHAVFHADQSGVVDPGVQAPVSGAYDGADPAGLFWSLRPAAGVEPAGTFVKSLEPQKITVSVEVEGERILAQEVERLYQLPGVKRVEVREAGVTGTLFIPTGEGRRPAIIVLGGSDGGTYEPAAAIYASYGYVTLALAYFGMEGLPDSLVNIPLETVERAINWLEAHPRVNQDAIGVWALPKERNWLCWPPPIIPRSRPWWPSPPARWHSRGSARTPERIPNHPGRLEENLFLMCPPYSPRS
jgi:hypothetical protein